MDGQALAGAYMGATANLQTIARHYAGADVRVNWRAAEHWLGLSRLTPTGFEILLNPYLFADKLGFIFFHEVGHIVLGHVKVESVTPLEDVGNESTASLLASLPPSLETVFRAVIDAEESQADSWAYEALSAFEGRFGPFLEAIR